jgi:hypothetical protein
MMNDAPPAVNERYRAMLMQRTEEARMIVGCAMRNTAGIPGGADEL